MATLALKVEDLGVDRLLEQVAQGDTVLLIQGDTIVAEVKPRDISALQSIAGFTANGTQAGNGIRQVGKWRLGTLKGRLQIADDFDDPLPDELLDAFEGNGS